MTDKKKTNSIKVTKKELLACMVKVVREVVNQEMLLDDEVLKELKENDGTLPLHTRYKYTKEFYEKAFDDTFYNVFAYMIQPPSYPAIASRNGRKHVVEDRKNGLLLPVSILYVTDVMDALDWNCDIIADVEYVRNLVDSSNTFEWVVKRDNECNAKIKDKERRKKEKEAGDAVE